MRPIRSHAYERSLCPSTLSIEYDGLTFPVAVWGTDGDRPILLLHGFPQEPATWALVAQCLARHGFQSFVPVQRGYAASTRPASAEGYTFGHFVGDAVGIADALQLRYFDVAGFGMGGLQAWLLAASHSQRVRSLTALRFPHPAAFAEGVRTDLEQAFRWSKLHQQFGPSDMQERTATMLADDAARLREFLVAADLPEPYLTRYVERLREPATLKGAMSWEHAVILEELATVPTVVTPTLYIWTDGPGLTRSTAEAAKLYVEAPYHQAFVPDVGNFILETSPRSVIDLMLPHLRAS